tara:strand:- start:820 stop:1332 length:513 start_codon:yes stop_codon:yes gene_type:complete
MLKEFIRRIKMFGWFGIAKYLMIISVFAGIIGYVMTLRADNAILKSNAVKMELANSNLEKTLQSQKEDFNKIIEANKQMNILINNLKDDLENLDKRFNKNGRDIGKLATKKPGLVEDVINRATDRAKRCVEIASGSPLTEQELQATKKSEINPECPSIANPNYIPYAVQK